MLCACWGKFYLGSRFAHIFYIFTYPRRAAKIFSHSRHSSRKNAWPLGAWKRCTKTPFRRERSRWTTEVSQNAIQPAEESCFLPTKAAPGAVATVQHVWLEIGLYASHHFAPCRSMTRGAAQHRSHQVASVRSDRAVFYIFCARPRYFAAARLRLQAKLGLFHCFRPKRIIENFNPNQWVLLSFIFFLFCTSFVVFLVKTALLFIK